MFDPTDNHYLFTATPAADQPNVTLPSVSVEPGAGDTSSSVTSAAAYCALMLNYSPLIAELYQSCMCSVRPFVGTVTVAIVVCASTSPESKMSFAPGVLPT